MSHQEHGLHHEQDYVLSIGKEIGVNPKILEHKKSTISCIEKLDMLKNEDPKKFSDWNTSRIIKALYFSRKDWPFYGVITPEFEKNVDQKEIFSRVLWMPPSSAEKYELSPKHTPLGMSWGTCTPFPLSSSVGTERGKIAGFLIVDYKPIKDLEINISIGGPEKTGLRTSMHLPYWAIPEILKRQFGEERVRLFNLNL